MRTIIGNIIRANRIFKIIENNDSICVGLSGGKDSMTLLYGLELYRQVLKRENNWNIKIVAVHLKMGFNKKIDYSKIKNFCKKNNIELHIVNTKISEILNSKKNKNKIQCSLCSKIKKAILIDKAKQLKCNKVAMGHHADDAIETLFMNMINEGRIATFKPITYLDRTKSTIIRPLILVREKEIIKVSKKYDFPIILKMCPLEGKTGREDIKLFINQNFYKSKNWSSSYLNFYIALLNGKQSNLWFYDNKCEFNDLRKIKRKSKIQ